MSTLRTQNRETMVHFIELVAQGHPRNEGDKKYYMYCSFYLVFYKKKKLKLFTKVLYLKIYCVRFRNLIANF